MALTISNPEAFARLIERRVEHTNCSYMEAVLAFCEERQLEPELIVPYLNDKMKLAIGKEARGLHLLPPTTGELEL